MVKFKRAIILNLDDVRGEDVEISGSITANSVQYDLVVLGYLKDDHYFCQLFVASDGHVPGWYASLLVYKVFGVLVGHSLLQGGPRLHCLPEWCYHFLATGDFQATAELLLSEKQAPLNAATALFHSLVQDIKNADMPDKIDALFEETTPTLVKCKHKS
eukprot:Seg4188.3 transcript_id=Seg4188.3/GoldUCD/mRNA.D3Y31 product="hypothetical protein" protein_id=Seg4188.3/GoldUCD/D3Y31